MQPLRVIAKWEQVLDKVKTYEQARNKVLDLVGDLRLNLKPYIGTLESSAGFGKVVGRQSFYGKGANARKIVVPYEGNASAFKSLLKHLNR